MNEILACDRVELALLDRINARHTAEEVFDSVALEVNLGDFIPVGLVRCFQRRPECSRASSPRESVKLTHALHGHEERLVGGES